MFFDRDRDLHLACGANFNVDEVRNICLSEEENPNKEAWAHLYSAMCTPEFCPEEHIRNGKYHAMLYPVSEKETEEMANRLSLAENSVNTPDDKFTAILTEMKSILEWSKSKHFVCSFWCIGAYMVLLFILGLSMDKADTKELKENLALVQDWAVKDTFLTPAETEDCKVFPYDKYNSATKYKYYELYKIARDIRDAERTIKYEKDTNEVRKARVEYAESLKAFNEKNAITAKESKEKLVANFQKQIDKENQKTRNSNFTIGILLCLIPLYLISCFQYGYNMNRFLNFRESMKRLSKVGSGLAAGSFACAYVVEETYSDGRTETHTEHPGLIFGFIGLMIMVFTSGISLLFQTINGIYYNYISKKVETSKLMRNSKIFDTAINYEKGTTKYYLSVIKNILVRNYTKLYTFDGRENRISYLVFITFNLLIFTVFKLIITSGIKSTGSFALGFIMFTMFMIFITSLASATVRRSHDMNVSGSLVWLSLLIPFFVVVFIIIPGSKGENRFGAQPEDDFN